jgi:hypothetical protein
LSDRRHHRQPVAQDLRGLGELIAEQPVVGEHERPAVDRLVGVGVLGQVEARCLVHPQLAAAASHHLAGQPEVVDVGVRDHEPGQVVE